MSVLCYHCSDSCYRIMSSNFFGALYTCASKCTLFCPTFVICWSLSQELNCPRNEYPRIRIIFARSKQKVVTELNEVAVMSNHPQDRLPRRRFISSRDIIIFGDLASLIIENNLLNTGSPKTASSPLSGTPLVLRRVTAHPRRASC